jgi:hypothetical protein
MKKLSIVVPYRDRPAHLQKFIGHVRAYFARDKLDKEIPYRVLIVEQEHGLPFNRGMLKNIGFLLTVEGSDYTCFHDVDYLPVWADYSWIEAPSMIIWHGAEQRPVVPGEPLMIKHNINGLFGGVVLIPNDLFRKVNGYANGYWGWGYEDIDLKRRFTAAGIVPGRRKGTFIALNHVNEGVNNDDTPTPIAIVNKFLFNERWSKGGGTADDGLSRMAFKILKRDIMPDAKAERWAVWERVVVRFDGHHPSAMQQEAYGKDKLSAG